MTDEIVIPSGDGPEDPEPALDDAIPGDEVEDETEPEEDTDGTA